MSPILPLDASSDPDWDLPLQVLGVVAGIDVNQATVVDFARRDTDLYGELAGWIRDIRRAEHHHEFWFPIGQYEGEAPEQRELAEGVMITALTEEQAQRIAQAHGIQGLPPPLPRALFLVVTRNDASRFRASRIARHELARFQSRMTVADTRFRGLTEPYFYVMQHVPGMSGQADQTAFMAYPRYPYFLRPPFSLEYVDRVHRWIEHQGSRPGEVADAIAASLYRQGLAYHQDSLEASIISWWIPIERLGDGSHDYKEVVSQLGGWLWHWGMWSTAERPYQGFYQDQQRMARVLRVLSQVRGETVHKGMLSEKRDAVYVEWLLEHLAHDLTVTLVQLGQEHGIAIFGQLKKWLNREMGLGP